MEWETFIEAIYINDKHTWEKHFSQLQLLKVCETLLLRLDKESL